MLISSLMARVTSETFFLLTELHKLSFVSSPGQSVFKGSGE